VRTRASTSEALDVRGRRDGFELSSVLVGRWTTTEKLDTKAN
jgi:hypothetical protein